MSALGVAAGIQVPVSRWFSAAVNVRQSGPADLYADTLESLSPRRGESVRGAKDAEDDEKPMLPPPAPAGERKSLLGSLFGGKK